MVRQAFVESVAETLSRHVDKLGDGEMSVQRADYYREMTPAGLNDYALEGVWEDLSIHSVVAAEMRECSSSRGRLCPHSLGKPRR